MLVEAQMGRNTVRRSDVERDLARATGGRSEMHLLVQDNKRTREGVRQPCRERAEHSETDREPDEGGG